MTTARDQIDRVERRCRGRQAAEGPGEQHGDQVDVGRAGVVQVLRQGLRAEAGALPEERAVDQPRDVLLPVQVAQPRRQMHRQREQHQAEEDGERAGGGRGERLG